MAGKGEGKPGLRDKNKAKALTTQGVAFDPAKSSKDYEPGLVTDGDYSDEGFYRFSAKQLEFLNEYAKDIDPIRAASAVGYSQPKRDSDALMQHPAIRREIEAIQDGWRYNIRMTAEHASGRHIKLMDKMEKDYDEADNIGDRAKMANSLVRASDSYLRAAGHFNHGGGGSDAQVVINIDLGDDKGVTIDGEVIEND